MIKLTTLITLFVSTTTTLARTDLSGCTSSISGASLIWYVPGTDELCQFLDCGGGGAPPKTDVPGCPLYSGTATYSPEFLAVTMTESGNGRDIWGVATGTGSGSSSRPELFTSFPTLPSTATPVTVPTTATVSATEGLTTPAQSLSGVGSATSVSSSVSDSATASTSSTTGPVSTGAASGLKINSNMPGFAMAMAGFAGAAVL